MTGPMQNAPATAPELEQGTDDLLNAVNEAKEPESSEETTEQDDTFDELSFTEQQLAFVQKLKKDSEQAKTELNHWRNVRSSQDKELGRLRKLENTLLEYDKEIKSLEEKEQEYEYDVDKLATTRAQKLNIQSQAKQAEAELLAAQTMQMVPDFQQLVEQGYIGTELTELAKAHNISSFDMNNAINALKLDSAKAVMIANSARRAKQIAELSGQNERIKSSTQDLAKKVTTANESGIVTNGKQGAKKLTTADIRNLSDAEIQERLRVAKEKGLFNKK